MDGVLFVLTLVAALGSGLVGGVFFAFSTFVMPALGRLPADQGLAAMQAINVKAVTPSFMSALFGTAAVAVVLIGWALTSLGEDWTAAAIAGATVYLAGVVGVTIARNVPLNDRMAALDPDAGARDGWVDYLVRWTAWNHVRTGASLAAAAALTVALTL